MDENQIKDTLQKLLAFHRELNDWLNATPATTPEERAQKQSVADQQDQVLQSFDQASLVALQLVGKDIGAQAAQLDALGGQITATARAIAQVGTVLGIAQQVITIAAEIIAIAAVVA